jgi:transcriptional regulator with XRE-family HTH domain
MNATSIRSIRLALGMTLSEFAMRTQMDVPELIALESGEEGATPDWVSRGHLQAVWIQPFASLQPRRWISAH